MTRDGQLLMILLFLRGNETRKETSPTGLY